MNALALHLSLPRSGELARAAAAVWARWQHRRKTRETRRYLAEMGEHMLHDIGVSRAQALFDLERRAP